MIERGGWTAELEEHLRKWHHEGYSASITAGMASKHLGRVVSRSAIIGKWYRMGLKRNGARAHIRLPCRGGKSKFHELGREMAKRKRKVEAAKKKLSPLAELLARSAEPLPPQEVVDWPLVQLVDIEDDQCRWIPGEPRDGCCGKPKVPGLSYCESHARRAYRPVEVTRAERETREIYIYRSAKVFA